MKTVNDIAYAIDCNDTEYSIFPIWRGNSLVKLTDELTGQSFQMLTGDFFEDYTLLDHNRNVIRLSELV